MTDSVLITGAGTGLGLNAALHLAARGYVVYATVLDEGQRAHVQAQGEAHGVALHPLILDVTDDTSIQSAVSTIVEECGGIFGVVHNAGLSLRGYFEDLDDDEIRRVVEVNLFGAMAVTRAVLPHMRAARRGRLIFISSVGGRIASMARTAYCASKFGLEGFAESLLQEVSPLGIQVSIVEPAIIKTERWTVHRGIGRRALDAASPYYEWFRAEEALADALVRSSPTRPEEVAHTIHTALTAPRPRLRYVVGRRARPILALRRYMPGELFERLYFGAAMYRVTRSKQRMVDSPSAAASQHQPTPIPFANKTGSKTKSVVSLAKAIQVLGLPAALRANKIKRFSNDALRGFYTTRALVALYNVGFLPELSERGSVNLRDFAAQHNLDATVLAALANYLYAVRVLKRRGDVYTYDRKEIVAETLNGPFQTVYAYQDVFHNLEALLKQEKRFGVDVTRDGELVARGSGAVGKLLIFPMVVDVLNRNKFDCVLDLCCGDATMLIDVCTRAPHLRGYGVDISPEAVAFGRKNLESHNLQNRVELLVGDAFNLDAVAEQVSGVQAATCVYALHEFASASSDKAVAMLRSFKRSFPGVPLIIGEVIQQTPEELRQRPGGVAEIQLWHDLSNQHLLTRDEWHSIFTRAGFGTVREDYMRFARTAIFTVK